MNKLLYVFLFTCLTFFNLSAQKQQIARQGQVTFFSYTNVENIEATNNQALSLLDLTNKKIAVSMLMRAFQFKKDLMYEHFNESYIESDLYPKATFEGDIKDFNLNEISQTKIINGVLTIHGVSKEIDIKTAITKEGENYTLSGEFSVLVNDFKIKIPPILASNIAKTISIKFKFQYQPYEE